MELEMWHMDISLLQPEPKTLDAKTVKKLQWKVLILKPTEPKNNFMPNSADTQLSSAYYKNYETRETWHMLKTLRIVILLPVFG